MSNAGVSTEELDHHAAARRISGTEVGEIESIGPRSTRRRSKSR
jgi:hypothetical protein